MTCRLPTTMPPDGGIIDAAAVEIAVRGILPARGQAPPGTGGCAVTETLAIPGKWAEQALRGQADPDAWFPDKGGSTALAKRICAACPVRAQCLDYAVSGADTWRGISAGIWGGTTSRERAQLRRQRKGVTA
jgi:WhiB family transcriptional regulator, redox-sensing transcriptional regulator